MGIGRSLGDALYRALTGGRTPASEGKSTQAKAAALMKKHKTTRAAAEAAGVSQRTMQKWVKGTQEATNTARSRNADKLAAAERKARMTKAGTKRVEASTGHDHGSGEGLRITATVQVSNDRRERTIRPGETLSAGAMESVLMKFETEGPEAAAQELQDLLDAYYFHGGRGSIESITDIAF